MIAKQDEFINEASATIFQLSQEQLIRMQCAAREDYYKRQRTVQHMLENQKESIEHLTKENASLQSKVTDLQNEINILQQKLFEKSKD